ncbi:MAG: histidine--tRNA ligase [Fidelibacterota bacterium]
MIRTVKGTFDILPDSSYRWRQLEEAFHAFMYRYGYEEIRTPAFEKTELFTRGVGTDTDIVSKEMYTWLDGGKTSLTLKPELTAPVIRAYIQHNLAARSPLTRLYYLDALFRRERPQKGRQRQFHQFGAEVIGSIHAEADVEIIAIAHTFLKEIGLTRLHLKLNSIGSRQARQDYRQALKEFLTPHFDALSDVSRQRFQTNPLRILDTKIPHEIALLDDAPDIRDYLTDEDRDHFSTVQDGLNALEIPYTIDKRMVRGLDYYTRTTFEITSEDLGSQDALCGGGRYDRLIELLGGKPTPAIGFAAGIERILIALETIETEESPPTPDIYLITLGRAAVLPGQQLAHVLRQSGFSVVTDLLHRSMKSQLRNANRSGARFAVIIGDSELETRHYQVKDLRANSQAAVAQNDIITYLTEKLKSPA